MILELTRLFIKIMFYIYFLFFHIISSLAGGIRKFSIYCRGYLYLLFLHILKSLSSTACPLGLGRSSIGASAFSAGGQTGHMHLK